MINKNSGHLFQQKKKLEEKERLEKMWEYEKILWNQGIRLIAGVDEAGRGPLAGPVVASAVILPPGFDPREIKDSKQLSERKRKELAVYIQENALAIGLGIVGVEYIDEHNILQATYEAMRRAVLSLEVKPEHCLVDGVKIPELRTSQMKMIDQTTIIKGDSLSFSIAAASIMAKTTRDQIMIEYASLYPQYGFDQHKGYGTSDHLRLIHKYGPSPIHRKSFKPIKELLAEL
ncbi:ribonuclease HII [Microaerobacter geothermalis]|uniref:ribonuclease HII n=1 Tax=Microaerobacter geothermalis TaxID=674972 RepID=UPI001F2F0A70|nr:ribonuclease HII [Microaerobacter geothermalis]MCF6094342.1 ribonuclease HII [Microaerobacter geothermalis]